MTARQASPTVTSVATQWASSGMWRFSQARSRNTVADDVTTRNASLGEARDRQVGLDAAVAIEPLRVDDAARRHGHVVGRDALQYGLRVAALDADLAERREVEEADARAHRRVLRGGVLEPGLPPPAVAVLGLLAACARRLGQEPVGALPAGRLAETGASLREPLVQWRDAHAARAHGAAIGELVGIVQAERLADAVGEIGRVALERLAAADVVGW